MSKCILCFAEHDRMFTTGESHIYCKSCSAIKKASVSVVSEIFDNLFLSGMVAAETFNGHRLYVHEFPQTYTGHCIHVPILIQRPISKSDRTGAVASIEKLNEASQVIEQHTKDKERLLVHCYGGVERSPLTVAWFLVTSKRCKDFVEAYAFLKSKRPVVSPRLFWLPKSEPLTT